MTVTQNVGRIERLTDWTGRSIQYGYDAQGRLATYTDAAGRPTGYGYDGASRLTSITTPAGRVTKITYDTQGCEKTVVRTTDAAHTTGPTTTVDYSTGAPCVTGQTKTVVSDPDAKRSWPAGREPAPPAADGCRPITHSDNHPDLTKQY